MLAVIYNKYNATLVAQVHGLDAMQPPEIATTARALATGSSEPRICQALIEFFVRGHQGIHDRPSYDAKLLRRG